MARYTFAPLSRIHRDQEGTISLIGVFSLLILAMVLGMIVNVGYQADNKIKMQNAADASTYSGGVVMARGMNMLAFTNHLLFDVFALTAFLREGAENHGEPMVPEILATWDTMASSDAPSTFTSFRNWHGEYVGITYGHRFPILGDAIREKVPYEQGMVTTFSAWALAFSNDMLATMEEILDGELIPEYQRAVVATIPDIAQLAANEIAIDHGRDRDDRIHGRRGPLQARLWTSRGTPVGRFAESEYRSLPVVDPVLDSVANQDYYLAVAKAQRSTIANIYLNHWNQEKLGPFNRVANMSQFYRLWAGFTCGQLRKLLSENELRNLPFVIRTPERVIQRATTSQEGLLSWTIDTVVKYEEAESRNGFLGDQYMYVGTAYWRPIPHALPGLFQDPVAGDRLTFSQLMLFVPRGRLVYGWRTWGPYRGQWGIVRQGHSYDWSLLNQNWRVQLVPATLPNLVQILQTPPEFDGAAGQPFQEVRLPELSGLTSADINMISHH